MVGSRGKGIVVNSLWFPFLENQHPSGKGIMSVSSFCRHGLNYIFYSDHYFIIIYKTSWRLQADSCSKGSRSVDRRGGSSRRYCGVPDLFHAFSVRFCDSLTLKECVTRSFATRYQCINCTKCKSLFFSEFQFMKIGSCVFDLVANYSQIFL